MTRARGRDRTTASTRTRIGLWGNFGTGNWGNECTLQAAISNVRLRMPSTEVACICYEPTDDDGSAWCSGVADWVWKEGTRG